MYIDGAREAFELGDFKRCLILFKHIDLTTAEIVKLYADAIYEMWLRRGDATNIDIIRDAYSTIFGTADFNLIPTIEYLRLSNIYIHEANFVGALQIMELACDRGHNENLLILLQCWVLFRKLNKNNESDQYMDYLCTAITLEGREERNGQIYLKNSQFKLVILYLLCAAHLIRKFHTSYVHDIRKKALKRYEAIISEAYQLHHQHLARSLAEANNWFDSSQVWVEIAEELATSTSPFILVAEDAYWEVRNLISLSYHA